MQALAEKLAEEALLLSNSERIGLAQRLLASTTKCNSDSAWSVEVEKRLDEINKGEMGTLSVEEVFAEYK